MPRGVYSTNRRPGIDLGLDVIATVLRPGQSLSCDDIAAVCGCSPQAIRYIQRRALAKMRERALELNAQQKGLR